MWGKPPKPKPQVPLRGLSGEPSPFWRAVGVIYGQRALYKRILVPETYNKDPKRTAWSS